MANVWMYNKPQNSNTKEEEILELGIYKQFNKLYSHFWVIWPFLIDFWYLCMGGMASLRSANVVHLFPYLFIPIFFNTILLYVNYLKYFSKKNPSHLLLYFPERLNILHHLTGLVYR